MKQEHPDVTRLKAQLGPAKYAKLYAEALAYRKWLSWKLLGEPHGVTYDTILLAKIIEPTDEGNSAQVF